MKIGKLVALVVVAGLTLCGLVACSDSSPYSTDGSAPGMTRFTDRADRFSLEFPSHWKAYDNDTNYRFLAGVLVDGRLMPVTSVLQYELGDVGTPQQLAERTIEQLRRQTPSLTVGAEQAVALGGAEAWIVDFEFDVSELFGDMQGVWRQHHVFTLTAGGSSGWGIDCGWLVSSGDPIASTCAQVVRSFRFLE